MAIGSDHRHLRRSAKQQLFVIAPVWVSANLFSGPVLFVVFPDGYVIVFPVWVCDCFRYGNVIVFPVCVCVFFLWVCVWWVVQGWPVALDYGFAMGRSGNGPVVVV